MPTRVVNQQQAEAWNGPEAAHFVVHADRYDRQLAPFTRALVEWARPEAHHVVSHHKQGDPQLTKQNDKVNAYHMSLTAYFAQKLRATPDGDGTLLDHAIVMHGATGERVVVRPALSSRGPPTG